MKVNEVNNKVECPALGTLYTIQKEFQQTLGFTNAPCDSAQLMSESLLGLIGEVGEVLQADQRWKKNGRNVKYDRENKVEEIADCFIYLLNACIYSDISSFEISNAIEKKIFKNVERYLENKESEKI